MRTRASVWGLILALISSFLWFQGCASNRPRLNLDAEEFVWPLPPDPPRIRYVKTIHSELDVGRKTTLAQRIAEAIFGRPPLRALRKPLSVHVDKNGRVYVVDTAWRKVLVFDFKNHQLNILGAKGKGMLLNPIGVTTDDNCNVYVTDAGGHRVMVYDSTGAFVKAFGGEEVLLRPSGIAVNSDLGVVYVVDTWAHQIKAFFVKTGKLLFTVGRNGEKSDEGIEGAKDQYWNRSGEKGEFHFPTYIAIDKQGRLYVVDTFNFRVQILAPNGDFIRTFGQVGDVPGTFYRPKGIGIDSEGHIYVADAAFNNVQIFDEEGRVLLYFGQFGSGQADIMLPAGLCVDDQDRIYVVDQLNSRIQVYQYLRSQPAAEEQIIAVRERR